MPIERTFSISRTARYAMLGTPDAGIRDVWVVCHGYGQLAANFLMEFEPLRARHRLIVAPEGLSRFYVRGESGQVGASWMTREARLHEIADYVGFLDQLTGHIQALLGGASPRLILLGFSQGTATVCRWVARGQVRPDRVVLWGGPLLPDEEMAEAGERLTRFRFTLVAGTKDRYVSGEALSREVARFQSYGIACDVITFDGGHHIDAAVLRQLGAW